MEDLFGLIRENSEWLFGGTSLAAIVLAPIMRKKSSAEKAADKPKPPALREGTDPIISTIAALTVIAAVAHGVGVDESPDLPNLLAKVLNDGTHRLLRRGLDRGYRGGRGISDELLRWIA